MSLDITGIILIRYLTNLDGEVITGNKWDLQNTRWWWQQRGILGPFQRERKFRKHRRIFVTMALIQNALLFLFFWVNWVECLVRLPTPHGNFLLYHRHGIPTITMAGLETDDHAEASYNITHKWYNILTGNLGYHTAHHLRGGLHWSKLPEFHKTIEDTIPPHLFRKPSIPFRWMPAK